MQMTNVNARSFSLDAEVGSDEMPGSFLESLWRAGPMEVKSSINTQMGRDMSCSDYPSFTK